MWFCCSICHINDTFVLDVEIWGIALFLDSGVNYAYSYVLGTISKLSLLLFVSHNTFSQSWSRGSWYSLTMEKEPRKNRERMNKMVKILGLSLFFLCYFLLSCWFLFYVSSSSCATKTREKMKILICIMWNLHCLVEWQLTLLSFMACHFLIHLRSGWHWLDFFIASVGIELWVWYFCIQLIWSLTVVILRTIEISTVAVNNWDQIF